MWPPCRVRAVPCLHLSRAGGDARVRFAAAVTRSLLPVCRDFPVVHPLRFRGLTLQLPSAVCVRLRLPLRPVHPRLATVNKKPFTFILETERGLNLSIQAVPREGAGRTIQLVSDLRGTGEEAGAWETSTPYESLLVTISQAVRGGKLPAGWYQVPVTKETLQAPAGLSSVADAVWTGNHLKMVRFAVENKTLSALNIRERLCELNIHRGNTVVQVTLAYEARK